MIKKIQQDSGARIQFRPEDESGGPARMCNLTGNHEQTQAAALMIQDLIDSTAVSTECYFKFQNIAIIIPQGILNARNAYAYTTVNCCGV